MSRVKGRFGPAVAAALLLAALGTTPAPAQSYEILHSFATSDGTNPYGQLLADSAGNLYGTTQFGGGSGNGTVFKLDASNNYTLTVLHDFAGSDGANSLSALIADSAGNLYGTTQFGGASSQGTVFKLDASNGYALTTLHDFAGSDGANPLSALLADSAGNLYGTTQFGGASSLGTVFKLDAGNGYALTTLHSFDGSDGAFPTAGLLADSAGNLYGTTQFDGASGLGTVFKLDASNGYALTTLHDFAGQPDGAYPFAGLLADSAGNLYGTTEQGGTDDDGSVFKLDASNGYALTTLHSFDGSVDGAYVTGGLIADSAGNFYGTTSGEGPSDHGTVFKLDASNGYALTTLHSFAGSDGAKPFAGLLADSAANLYGATVNGGASDGGVVFRTCLPPIAVASGDASICAGSSTPLSGSGGVSCSWAPATGLSDPNSCNPSASPTRTTTYALTVADANGCVSTNAPKVTVTIVPIAVASGSAVICAGGSTPLSGSGGVSCSWAPSTGLSDPNSCNPSASPSSTTTYTLTVTDVNGCVSTNNPTVSVSVNPTPPAPTITVPNSVVVGATGVAASVPNNSGSTYAWTLTGGTITAGQGSSSILFDAGPAGTTMVLSVVETNSSGCSSPAGMQKIQVDFLDVPPSHPFHDFVDTIARNGITSGCGGGNFCPDDPVTRAQMAVFLLVAEHGSGYTPPACTGIFGDVSCPGGFAVDWIEEIYHEGITAGCSANPLLYCPNDPVTRAQMAVFLLVAEHGPGYTPPACAGIFGDVSCPSGFAVDWIEELYHEGIAAGCSANPLLYCPNDPNTRGQMAVFLTVTFGLQ